MCQIEPWVGSQTFSPLASQPRLAASFRKKEGKRVQWRLEGFDPRPMSPPPASIWRHLQNSSIHLLCPNYASYSTNLSAAFLFDVWLVLFWCSGMEIVGPSNVVLLRLGGSCQCSSDDLVLRIDHLRFCLVLNLVLLASWLSLVLGGWDVDNVSLFFFLCCNIWVAICEKLINVLGDWGLCLLWEWVYG